MAATSKILTAPQPVRCAIYTRKSTDEGLNQDFNSLDAQREAGDNFVRSQRHEGWSLEETRYDDGGYTGADMNRPALKRLMADIDAGKIDCVVVYKVDRLSRSIRDFAKMVEVFEKRNVSFVSVTQQFNTTNSLGRLTLNILLSFAQFEREIISERTRDKVQAARKKGKWTGGHLILGYDLDARGGRLVINPEEAQQVRSIFEWYLAGESISNIASKAHKLGWRNKQWTTKEGKQYGGHPLRRTHLYNLLANVLYAGRVKVGDEVVPAEHEAIIDPKTFDLTQAKLGQTSWERGSLRNVKVDSLLRGMLYCSCCGAAMYGTYSVSRERRYRYYVCSKAHLKVDGYCTSRSVSAPAVEEAVVEGIRRVAIHPEVLDETALQARQHVREILERLRSEQNGHAPRMKNLRSQLSRARTPEAPRLTEVRNELTNAENHDGALRQGILKLEKLRIDEKDLRHTLGAFDDLWRVMTTEEQRGLLRLLVEKVGYDGRTGKVTISFVSVPAKGLAQKGVGK